MIFYHVGNQNIYPFEFYRRLYRLVASVCIQPLQTILIFYLKTWFFSDRKGHKLVKTSLNDTVFILKMSQTDDTSKLTIFLTYSYSAWFTSLHEGRTLQIITKLHIDAISVIFIIFEQMKTENIKTYQYIYGINVKY